MAICVCVLFAIEQVGWGPPGCCSRHPTLPTNHGYELREGELAHVSRNRQCRVALRGGARRLALPDEFALPLHGPRAAATVFDSVRFFGPRAIRRAKPEQLSAREKLLRGYTYRNTRRQDMQRTLPMRIILFSSSVIAQVISMGIMPRTLGFTNLPYTFACLVSMDLSVWLAARLLQLGASLGVMIPAMAAFVPTRHNSHRDLHIWRESFSRQSIAAGSRVRAGCVRERASLTCGPRQGRRGRGTSRPPGESECLRVCGWCNGPASCQQVQLL